MTTKDEAKGATMKLTLNLPDFIIIGANKAGTTSVANYLNSHSRIIMSLTKEPMFFSYDPPRSTSSLEKASLATPYFATSLEEYSKLFEGTDDNCQILGEASTAYLASPFSTRKQIKKILPNVKLIAILRNPADRAVSAYKMCYGNGIETRAFREILDEAPSQTRILQAHGVREYIRNGLYGQLLSLYYELFDKEQLFVCTYDKFCAEPYEFLSDLLNFIGLENENIDMSKRYNEAIDHLSNNVAIANGDIESLRDVYREDILYTQSITGLDLSDWLRV